MTNHGEETSEHETSAQAKASALTDEPRHRLTQGGGDQHAHRNAKPHTPQKAHRTTPDEPLAFVAYTFDGTTEGLLTAIFKAYERHEDPQDIAREGSLQPRLGQSVIEIGTEAALAQRVRDGIIKRGGRYAWELVLHASLADDDDAPTTVYRFVRLITSRAAASNAMLAHELTDPTVGRMVELDRFVRNERHHMLQFLRFEHMQGDIWFACCNPKANVVGLLMDWFAGRFNTQRFIIYDEVHCVAGVFDGKNWMLVSTEEVTLPAHSAEEATMQAAWKGFYDAVSIPIRYHPELRRQFMPKRFWKNILEVRDEMPRNRQLQFDEPKSQKLTMPA